jgi:hypothetical protein
MRTSQKPGAASQHKSGTNPSHEKRAGRIFSALGRACADGRSVSQASPVVEVLGERRLWFGDSRGKASQQSCEDERGDWIEFHI